MIGRKADHAAQARRRLGAEQGVVICLDRLIFSQRREVVIEDVDPVIGRVHLAPDPGVAGAEIAGGIIGRRRRIGRADLALPRPPHALRGNLHPAAGQRIVAPVRAGEIAGLEVKRLINEPTAAALAFGLTDRGDREPFLVFDLGGGTFDVSIVEMFEGIVEVRASAGDNRLGGDDFDEALVKLVEPLLGNPDALATLPADRRHALLTLAAERTRRALSSAEEADFTIVADGTPLTARVTTEAFEEAAAPLVKRLRDPVIRALRDSHIDVKSLSDIVLVGGAPLNEAFAEAIEADAYCRDAAVAVAELALFIEQRAARDGDSVGTIGLLNVPGGSINVVPGRCQFSLDLRAPTDAQRDALVRDVLDELARIAQRRGLRYTLEESMRAAAAPSAPAWQHQWERAVDTLGVPVFRMPSGAGHDAMKLHEIMPQAMLFTRGQNSGISHNPLESTTNNDMQLAVDAFTQVLRQLAEEPQP